MFVLDTILDLISLFCDLIVRVVNYKYRVLGFVLVWVFTKSLRVEISSLLRVELRETQSDSY